MRAGVRERDSLSLSLSLSLCVYVCVCVCVFVCVWWKLTGDVLLAVEGKPFVSLSDHFAIVFTLQCPD